MILFAVQMQ